MDERERRNQIPCIVDTGIVASRKDMLRILRDLGQVRYVDTHRGHERAEGEGVVTSVFAHPSSATIFVNKRLYINVNGFDFLRLGQMPDGSASLELVDAERSIRLMPVGDPLQEAQAFSMEPAFLRASRHVMLESDLAEVFQDEEDEEP